MSSTASDTLSVARRLKTAGVEAEQANAIVEAVDKLTGKFVTVEYFDAAVERLDTRIDTTAAMLDTRIDTTAAMLDTRIDALRSDLQASIHASQAAMTRFIVIVAGVIIAANALTIGILSFFPRDGAAI